MVIKVKNVRLNVDKISFMEYDPKGKYEKQDKTKGNGIAVLIIDGVQLTLPDPTAAQIWEAYKWETQGYTYIADKGYKQDWKREI